MLSISGSSDWFIQPNNLAVVCVPAVAYIVMSIDIDISYVVDTTCATIMYKTNCCLLYIITNVLNSIWKKRNLFSVPTKKKGNHYWINTGNKSIDKSWWQKLVKNSLMWKIRLRKIFKILFMHIYMVQSGSWYFRFCYI